MVRECQRVPGAKQETKMIEWELITWLKVFENWVLLKLAFRVYGEVFFRGRLRSPNEFQKGIPYCFSQGSLRLQYNKGG